MIGEAKIVKITMTATGCQSNSSFPIRLLAGIQNSRDHGENYVGAATKILPRKRWQRIPSKEVVTIGLGNGCK